VLEGADLSDQVTEHLANAVDGAIGVHCPSDYVEEWEVDSLLTEIRTYWPCAVTAEQVRSCVSTDELYDLLMSDATRHYAEREAELGAETMRDIERQVMLNIIDTRWREHLREMDYLQEGIHLRGLGQKDPLTEWQREGFEMFGQLVTNIGLDFVKYIMHVQVVAEEHRPAVRNVTYTAPEDPSEATEFAGLGAGETPELVAPEPEQQQPVVKSEWEKTPRNAPCPCGSGRKYKQCHGAA
jgi:preprotein translocase subunit SecA